MNLYNKEDFQTDVDWLREQGVCTEEVNEFVISLIKKGFGMSREEFLIFLEEVKNET